MFRCIRRIALTSCFLALSSFQIAAQTSAPKAGAQAKQVDSGWRISPEKINIQLGDDRTLQALDDFAQELHGAVWSVDSSDRADLQEANPDRVVLHAKAVGTVRVTAVIGNEKRFRDVKIWSEREPLPAGRTNWAVHPIGRELGDIPAVPTDDGPNMFSLERAPGGRTYLRAGRDDGIQIWSWLMPETARDAELVCGDWLGGAVISSNRTDSYTLYAVGKDGKLRWQYEAAGRRKGLAISTDHIVHLLSQSSDRTVASVAGLDEQSGVKKFENTLPASVETQLGIRKEGATFTCAPGTVASRSPIAVTRLFVNSDGYAYVAFTQNARTSSVPTCTPGSAITSGEIRVARDESLVLWQIQSDGTYRSTVVEAVGREQPFSSAVDTVSPTGSIIPDGLEGVLISVQLSHRASFGSAGGPANHVVYRVNPAGQIVYKFPLPRNTGRLHDEMVLGENEMAFATRGGVLVAFNVRTGNELWRWASHTPEIEVFAALANCHCAVQTPTALVEVADSGTSKELLKGKAMMDWLGNMYVKHR